MAIYYLDAKVISRSTGRSAVAAAAYRSGEILFDERYEKEHDYSKKQNIVYTEILLPEGAPLGLKDRERLWNEVERCEKRKDAQLARELVIALPKELTLQQNIELIKEYIQSDFVDKGMIADICVHNDKAIDGEPQPHAHVLLTMREMNLEKGEEGREVCFGKKIREWNLKENLLLWRESWAEVANRHLALNGHDRRIDHRTLEEQGIELTPGIKVGASVAREHMAKLIEQQKVSQENGEKIYEDPQIALKALTRQQSTFTHHDLAKFINRHSVASDQFERVYEKVKTSEHLVHLGLDEQGRDRFTTKEMLDIEMKMAEHAECLVERQYGHKVKEKVKEVQAILGVSDISDKTNSSIEPNEKSLSAEQRAVFEHLIDSGDIKCVVGFAGSGKSYLLGAAREAWENEGYKVLGATLSGIAAENLEKSSGIESRTIASRSYYWDKGEQLLTSRDILVVDEAGMIGSRQMERLLREVERGGAKVILVGDPQQLQAIEAGASFRAIAEQVGFIELTEIWRQQEEWQREATLLLAQRQVAKGLEAYERHGFVHEFETQAMAKKALVEKWFEESQIDNISKDKTQDKTQIILSFTRKDVQELNEMARFLRKENGEIGEDHTIATERGIRQFAVGDRIYFLENERINLDVKNGTLGTIEKIDGKELLVRLDRGEQGSREREHVENRENEDNRDNKEKQGRLVVVDIERYNKLEYGYAATIHKAQGVTVDKSYVLASKHMDSHATYVGLSRHRENVQLYWSKEEFNHEQNLSKSLSRVRSKDVTLDYSGGQIKDKFASYRHIEVSTALAKEISQSSLEKKINDREKGESQEEMVKIARIEAIERTGKEKTADKTTEKIITKEEKERDIDLNKGQEIGEQQKQKDLEELMRFKKDYESKHPEVAKRLTEEIQPESKKRAMSVEKELRELKEQIKKDPLAILAKKELNALILKVTKDKELMQELKERAPGLTAQITIKAKELERDRNRCRSR